MNPCFILHLEMAKNLHELGVVCTEVSIFYYLLFFSHFDGDIGKFVSQIVCVFDLEMAKNLHDVGVICTEVSHFLAVKVKFLAALTVILENVCHELSVFLMIAGGTFFTLLLHLYSALTKQTRTHTQPFCDTYWSLVSYLKLQWSQLTLFSYTQISHAISYS